MSEHDQHVVNVGDSIAQAHPAHVNLAMMFTSVKVMGPPMSPKLVELIAHLYSAEEAELCKGLNFLYPRPAETVAKLCKRDPSRVLAALRVMAERRVIFGSEDKFMLYPLIPGLFEYGFMLGRDTPWHARYAKLLDELYGTGYVSEYLSRRIDAIRNIPVNVALDGTNHVVDDSLMKALLEAHEHFAMLHVCPCRHAKRLVGHTCKRATPEDGCLLFGEYTKSTVANGNGRTISKNEMIEIVERRRKQKLFFLTANVDPTVPNVICTCCDCCCHALETSNHYSDKFIAQPEHVASVDEPLCNQCGRCARACNTYAQVMQDGKHVFRAERCLGCGYCLAECNRQAIRLVENPSFRKPSRSYTGLLAQMIPPVLVMGVKIKLKRAFGSSDKQLPAHEPETDE